VERNSQNEAGGKSCGGGEEPSIRNSTSPASDADAVRDDGPTDFRSEQEDEGHRARRQRSAENSSMRQDDVDDADYDDADGGGHMSPLQSDESGSLGEDRREGPNVKETVNKLIEKKLRETSTIHVQAVEKMLEAVCSEGEGMS